MNKLTFLRKIPIHCWFLILCFLSTTILHFCSIDPTLFIFQTRDLFRMQQISDGIPIFYGPELLGGGHTPGPFYYLMFLIPYVLGGMGGVIFSFKLYFGFSISAITIFGFKRWGKTSAIVIFLLLTTSYFFQRLLASNLNPSAAPVFAIILTILLLLIKDSWGFKKWFLYCLIINLAIQVHASFMIFYLFSVFLLRKKHLKQIIMGFILSLSAYIPYLTGTLYCSSKASSFCPQPFTASTSSGFSFLSTPVLGILNYRS